jgi:ComF family protein
MCCGQCAAPLPDPHYPLCGQCIKKPPFFDRAVVAHSFEEPLRGLLHRFKYQQALDLAGFFSHLMFESLYQLEVKPDCLIPVPMHRKRLQQRGFNQSLILTRLLAKTLQIPYDFTSCQKVKHTRPQAELEAKERQKNLHQAFSCTPLPHQHLAIIDDLLTTGSTASELAYTLKQAGAKRVDIWCVARA